MSGQRYPLRQKVALLQKYFPLTLVLFVFAYQLVPVRWVQDTYGHSAHFTLEIFFYGTVGPLLTYWVLGLITRWLDDRDRAEKLARSIEHRLASITTASADAIVGSDAAGRIDFWNRGAELLFGYPAGKISGQPLSVLLDGDSAAKVELQWLEKIVQQEEYLRGHETVCRDGDGRRVDVEMTATQLKDEAGQFAGISFIIRDITERKRRLEQIERLNSSLNQQVVARTQELEEKVGLLARANDDLQKLDQMRTEFVSLVSHQLRAPLTNMNGAVTRIQSNCDVLNPTCTRMLDILCQQTMRLERLVKDVLNSTRLESGELPLHIEPVSVTPIINQVVGEYQARVSDRPIRFLEKPGLPLVFADRDRIAEVLLNLLDNADKYSPNAAEIVVGTRADLNDVTISVTDAGPGLPEEDLSRVFDKFYRTDNSDSQQAYGYGLGLYVCRLLIEEQGGRIWAENGPRSGAVFSFSLPVLTPESSLKEKAGFA